jgi:radical SAM superfamily enzyme YgiQ (UPF0313 family)
VDIVLATLNAKYIHASFGLRYLMANLGELAERATIAEFDINQRPIDIVEQLLAYDAKIIGLGVYVWNAEQSLKVAHDLKRLRPDVILILGGPEVSYETEQQEICSVADFVLRGEADVALADLCRKLLAGRRPLMKIIDAPLPEFARDKPAPLALAPAAESRPMALPYDLYTDHDLAHRVMYVEASRGCPFKCEFCLSSLDVPVRNAPLEEFLTHMQRLLDRGAKNFKFVDRTFNLNLPISRQILQFFLDRYRPGMFVHFEMIPDRLPEALREIIAKFPPGALQFEVGIQTLNPEVEKLISRRQDHARLADNLQWLRDQTGVHVHADLIVGLPGEDLASFGRGFDQLWQWRPQEIQIGILKRLRGTPITRHDAEWKMVYSPHPPYEILQTRLVSFAQLQKMRRFARYWDLVANSGNFGRITELLLSTPLQNASADMVPAQSFTDGPFARFFAFSDWLYDRSNRRTHGISRGDLTLFCREYLVQQVAVSDAVVDDALKQDQSPRRGQSTLKRQAQHLQSAEA